MAPTNRNDTTLRPGPEPFRTRVDKLDPDVLAAGLRALVSYAQGVEAPLTVPARDLLESVVVAYDAARARECIASGTPVRMRWLAALAGVSTERIRQLVRARALQRRGSCVDAESAKTWLAIERQRAPITAHQLDVSPDWWLETHARFGLRDAVERIIAEHAPAGCQLGYDRFSRAILLVPVGARVDVVEAERLRADVRARIDALDPRPSKPPTPAQPLHDVARDTHDEERAFWAMVEANQ